MSDRWWTRWGRRRPFLISSALATALLMLFMPFLPNIWVLAAFNLLFQVAIDIGTCTEALYFEVIPQPQRGRAVAIRQVVNGLAGLFFGLVLFAHFDDRFTINVNRLGLAASFTWTGEHTLYAVVALALLGNAALYMFLVRETPVQSPLLGQPFNPWTFVNDVFGDRRWYMVYLYYTVPTVIAGGAAQFGPLVMTEVFGYSKADMTRIGVPSMLITLFILTPIMGWVSDRVPRVRMFQFGVYGSVAWVIWHWIYIKFLAPLGIPVLAINLPWPGGGLCWSLAPVNGVPSLAFLFCNGLVASVFSTALFVTYGALLFDLVPSNLMGTLASGFGLISSVIGAAFLNMCGWFVTGYSRLFSAASSGGAVAYDYTAIYLFQAICGLIGIAMYTYFLRQYKRGRITEYGKCELRSDGRVGQPV
jgi:hypothetical protein